MAPDGSILQTGDRFPNFGLPDADGLRRIFYFEVGGGPLLVIAARDWSAPVVGAWLRALAGNLESLAETGCETYLIGPAAMPDELDDIVSGIRFVDTDGQTLSAVVPARQDGPRVAAIYVLDPNQRVLASISSDAGDEAGPEAINRMISVVEAWHAEPVPEVYVKRQAPPVMMLENLLPPELCLKLIDDWKADHQEGMVNTGFENVADPTVKRNREHVVQNPEMKRAIASTLGARVAPEFEKVFHFRQPLKFEAFTVLSYVPERRDFFGPHRDNLRAEHQRRFAMSLNLNADFDGGELVFPEYGRHRFKPSAGGAVIFSCSILHEALPLSRGQRWVMTTFLCDP
ncbi:MAG: hypothetical protein HOL85_16220 [Rhodospirillaceae bacterium]|nr:hypothetical protein [Rhodospirillaceae bacterium]